MLPVSRAYLADCRQRPQPREFALGDWVTWLKPDLIRPDVAFLCLDPQRLSRAGEVVWVPRLDQVLELLREHRQVDSILIQPDLHRRWRCSQPTQESLPDVRERVWCSAASKEQAAYGLLHDLLGEIWQP